LMAENPREQLIDSRQSIERLLTDVGLLLGARGEKYVRGDVESPQVGQRLPKEEHVLLDGKLTVVGSRPTTNH
jgi:hypothetical protein